MESTPAAPLPTDPYLAGLIEGAVDDLASRLKVTRNDIEFVQFESVVWPDRSLGCPQPDMAYPQVQVDGYRILLQAANQIYYYHGGGNRPPFLCENVKSG